jgi:hypothetical protein
MRFIDIRSHHGGNGRQKHEVERREANSVSGRGKLKLVKTKIILLEEVRGNKLCDISLSLIFLILSNYRHSNEDTFFLCCVAAGTCSHFIPSALI